MVAAAADRAHPDAARALEQLCGDYWPPLYSFARRTGLDRDRAADAVQEFFTILIEKRSIGGADRACGRFRSYLLGAFQHFLHDARDRERAAKRGGGRTALSISFAFDDEESRYQNEPADPSTPEAAFDRAWALLLLNRVLARLRAEYEHSGKLTLFELLKSRLTGESGAAPFAEIAAARGTTEGAIKVAAHRLRERFRELLRMEVAHTVDSTGTVDDELKHLMEALGA